jgi:rsbT antagonist protein RsbS
MSVPILKQGDYLIASIQSALSDGEVLELQQNLLDLVARHRALGVIVDVTAMDVIDTYATRSLCKIAATTRLRGAATVVVGVQPDVATAMVRFGLTMDEVQTALDLEEGLELLDRLARERGAASGG